MTLISEVLILSAITLAVTYVSHRVIKLYWGRRNLPPGPFPWPFLGNILWFRKNAFAHEVMNDMAAIYGPVFTMYFGDMPNVVINDPEIGLQVLKKHTFAGRPSLDSIDWFFENGIDIIFADFGKEFEALRKVGHSAARKYSVSPQLAVAVNETVDRLIERVKEEPFNTDHHMALMMIAILAQAAFGKKYDFEDEEFLKWKETTDVFRTQNKYMMIIFLVPILRFVFFRTWKTFRQTVEYQRYYIKTMYDRSLKEYTDGKNETFCDAMISAKKEAELEESWMAPYLKQQNLYYAVSDLFSAGTDTTRMTLCWFFLIMCKYPETQEKMRQEVDTVIGENYPQVEDKENCPYINAFISESMRFRTIVPQGVAHKATVDTEINGHKIKAGTTVIVSLYNSLHDENQWKDPEVFKIDRFLDQEGKFISKPNKLFIPFSDGRRACPGNKLALNNMFIVLARFLQRTKKIEVVGEITDEMMKGDLSLSNGWFTPQYNLKLTLR